MSEQRQIAPNPINAVQNQSPKAFQGSWTSSQDASGDEQKLQGFLLIS